MDVKEIHGAWPPLKQTSEGSDDFGGPMHLLRSRFSYGSWHAVSCHSIEILEKSRMGDGACGRSGNETTEHALFVCLHVVSAPVCSTSIVTIGRDGCFEAEPTKVESNGGISRKVWKIHRAQ